MRRISLFTIKLNPSTADGYQDDATIRRCISYAKQWGYGSLHVVNLFAYRATDPQDLLEVLDPIGPENFYHISKTTAACQCIIFAWGNNANHIMTDKFIKYVIGNNINHLGLTKQGHPKHPLYLKKDLQPIPWQV